MYKTLVFHKTLLLISFSLSISFCQKYNIYFGDLHSHTAISDGSGTPSEAFKMADSCGADFLAITDHSGFNEDDWQLLHDTASNFTTSSFVPIIGFEHTVSWGHINVYNTDWFTDGLDIHSFYTLISSDKHCIVQWNHPTEYSDEFYKFSFYSLELDSVINLIEIHNAKRDLLFESSYVLALDKGWHVSPTANSDMHEGKWIKGYDARTAILSTGLTREELFIALRNRRTYATLDKNIQIKYSINQACMGSILPVPKRCMASINITDPDSSDPDDLIKKVEIITKHAQVAACTLLNSHSLIWNPELKIPDSTNIYYFVKVTNAEGKIALTAPVWLQNTPQKKNEFSVIPQKKISGVFDISGRLKKLSQYNQMNIDRYSCGIYIVKQRRCLSIHRNFIPPD